MPQINRILLVRTTFMLPTMMRRLLLLVFLAGAAAAHGQAPFSHKTPQSVYADSRGLFDRALYAPAAEGFDHVLQQMDAQTDLAEQAAFFKAICAVRLLNRDAGDQVLAFLDSYPSTARRKEAVLEMAEYSFNRRKYADARDWLRRLDGLYLPKSQRAEVQFKLGYSHFLLGEYDQARPQLAAAKSSKFPIAASAQYYYGHIAYLDTNDVTAMENLEPLQNHEEFGMVVPYYLAQIYARQGLDDKLLTLGESLLKNATAKRTPEIAKLIGQSLYKKKRYPEALPYLAMHRDLGGKMSADDFYQLGVVNAQTGHFKEAIQALNKISSNQSEVSEFGLYLLADCYVKEGQFEEALSAYQAVSALAKDPVIQEESAYQAAKLTYQSSSPFGNAIDMFKRFLVDFPQTEHRREANEYLANLYITSKDYSRAMEAIVQTGMGTMAMREAYQRVAYFRAVELFQVSDWAAAQEYFNKSLGYPQNLTFVALSHFWLGELAYRKGDAQEALAQFESFLKTPGSYTLTERPTALYNKAYCLYKLDRLEDASAAFRVYLQDAKSNDRKTEDATLRLADLYFLLGKHALAEEYYAKSVRMDAQGRYAGYAMYQQALCEGLLNNSQQKIDLLMKLSKNANPNDAFGGKYSDEAQFEAAQTQLRMGSNAAAEANFKEFIRRVPNSEKARRAALNIAIAQRNDQRLDAAIASFQDIVKKYPGTPEAREAITTARSVYDEANRIDDYLTWVQGIDFAQIRASELDSVAYMSAYDKYASSKFDEAMAGFDRYMKRFPDGFFTVKANHYAGESARRLNKAEEALGYFRKVTQAPVGEHHINAWTWILRISSARKNADEMLIAAESVLALSDDASLLREANVAMMRGHQALKHLEVAYGYSEVVAADERNSPEVRTEAKANVARNAMTIGMGSRTRKADFLSSWFESDLDAVQRDWVTKSLNAYMDLKKNGPAVLQAEASYYQALILYLDGSHSASNEEIFWLIDNLPGQGEWRFKSLLVLAHNYDALDDKFQANYTLDFIIAENFIAETVEQAKVFQAILNTPAEDASGPAVDTIIETPTLP
jgi:TolA-binding protein